MRSNIDLCFGTLGTDGGRVGRSPLVFVLVFECKEGVWLAVQERTYKGSCEQDKIRPWVMQSAEKMIPKRIMASYKLIICSSICTYTLPAVSDALCPVPSSSIGNCDRHFGTGGWQLEGSPQVSRGLDGCKTVWSAPPMAYH